MRLLYRRQNFQPPKSPYQCPQPYQQNTSPQELNLLTEAPRNYNRLIGQLLLADMHDVRRDTVRPNSMHLQTLSAGHFSTPHQPHQPKRAYQADAKESDYKSMEETATDKPTDAWYTSHDQDDNHQYYASDYHEEVFVNFY